jgi:hypothetical protein
MIIIVLLIIYSLKFWTQKIIKLFKNLKKAKVFNKFSKEDRELRFSDKLILQKLIKSSKEKGFLMIQLV